MIIYTFRYIFENFFLEITLGDIVCKFALILVQGEVGGSALGPVCCVSQGNTEEPWRND